MDVLGQDVIVYFAMGDVYKRSEQDFPLCGFSGICNLLQMTKLLSSLLSTT